MATRALSADAPHASCGNAYDYSPSRRSLIAGAAVAGLAIGIAATPAMAAVAPGSVPHALAANARAESHYNALPEDLERRDPAQFKREEEMLNQAYDRVAEAVPASWSEFVALLDFFTVGGTMAIDDDNAADLLRHARRLEALS